MCQVGGCVYQTVGILRGERWAHALHSSSSSILSLASKDEARLTGGRGDVSLVTLLIILLIVAVVFGGFGTTRGWGYYGWSPLGLVVLILLILLLTGNLSL
jgi:hypothetical protein